MFGRKTVSEDVEDWLVAQFEWAIDARLLRNDTPLVLPTSDFFTAQSGPHEELVPSLVGDILRVMNRPNDHIDCTPIDRPSAELRAAGAFEMTSEVAGAWDGDAESSVIFYDPEMTARPLVLIATLVHEVVHHVMHRHHADDLAEGPEEELQTDAQMITTGFGLIAMMGAEEAGWSGYMRQPTRAHGLAMFLALRGIEPKECAERLTSRMRKALQTSYKQVEKLNDMARLRDTLLARAT